MKNIFHRRQEVKNSSGFLGQRKLESTVGVGKPEWLQLRDAMIADGFGPADITFGPDLFDARISETHAPYSDGLTEVEAAQGTQPVAEIYGTNDERIIRKEIQKHIQEVISRDRLASV